VNTDYMKQIDDTQFVSRPTPTATTHTWTTATRRDPVKTFKHYTRLSIPQLGLGINNKLMTESNKLLHISLEFSRSTGDAKSSEPTRLL